MSELNSTDHNHQLNNI